MQATRNTTTRNRHRNHFRRQQAPCGICGQDIDYTLTTPHPDSFEVDHIVPLAAGGTDTPDNCQASHRHCNRDKWDRLVGQTTAEATRPRQFVTTRTW